MKELLSIGNKIAKSDQKQINGGKRPGGPGNVFSTSCPGGGTPCTGDNECDIFVNGYCYYGCCAGDDNEPPN